MQGALHVQDVGIRVPALQHGAMCCPAADSSGVLAEVADLMELPEICEVEPPSERLQLAWCRLCRVKTSRIIVLATSAAITANSSCSIFVATSAEAGYPLVCERAGRHIYKDLWWWAGDGMESCHQLLAFSTGHHPLRQWRGETQSQSFQNCNHVTPSTLSIALMGHRLQQAAVSFAGRGCARCLAVQWTRLLRWLTLECGGRKICVWAGPKGFQSIVVNNNGTSAEIGFRRFRSSESAQ